MKNIFIILILLFLNSSLFAFAYKLKDGGDTYEKIVIMHDDSDYSGLLPCTSDDEGKSLDNYKSDTRIDVTDKGTDLSACGGSSVTDDNGNKIVGCKIISEFYKYGNGGDCHYDNGWYYYGAKSGNHQSVYDVAVFQRPPCTDKVPEGWIDYPMAYGSCVPYQDLTPAQKQIFPDISGNGTGGGAMVCNTCFSPPYDKHNCTAPSVLDTSSGVAKCITPACPSGQFLDANSTCQDLSIPSDFPSDKGHQSIREDGDNFSPSSCVPGKVFKSGIAYAKVIGWNSEKKVCEIATLFCDSGFTFDSVTNACVAPSDIKTFDPNKDEISQALADACTSGKWAKKWTLDYCNQPTCYIALTEQNYNLHCGNMYYEYDCTSDYRLKKYVQASCGLPADKDKQNVDLSIGSDTSSGSTGDGNATSGSGNGSKNYIPDLNTSTSNLDVVSAINSASSGLSNSISALDSHVLNASSKLGTIDGKLSSIASDVGSIKDALHVGDDKVGDLDSITNSSGTGSFDNLVGSVKGYIGLLKSNFNNVQGLLSNGFTFNAPVGSCKNPHVSVYGKDIELSICQPLATFRPLVYFFTVIGFTVLSIKIFLLGSAI